MLLLMTEINLTTQLFTEAAMLMLTGMGFVFAFLGFLILVIKYIITPLATRFPDDIPKKPAKPENNSPVIAAITAAIKQYRQQHPPKSN